MVFDKEDSVIIISQEERSIDVFLEHLDNAYPKLQNDNLIIDLSGFVKLTPYNVIAFLEISKKHRKNGKSFVMVSKTVTYDDIPDEINLVPTLQEARDMVDMEEMERELGL